MSADMDSSIKKPRRNGKFPLSKLLKETFNSLPNVPAKESKLTNLSVNYTHCSSLICFFAIFDKLLARVT